MFSIRLLDYLKERFPLVNMMLFAIVHLAVYSTAVQHLSFDLLFLLGILATISFFFRLRVMDEIKDFDVDAVNHPGRVLQSGGVTLRFLIGLSVLLTVSEFAWSFFHGWVTVLSWLVAIGYAILMRYEFFVGEWLKQRLVLYAFSHMVIMPLVVAWLWFAYRSDITPVLALLMLLSFLGGFVFELARKTHSPDAERPEIETYSSLLGYGKAVWLIQGVLWLSMLCQVFLFLQLEMPWWTYFIALLSAFWITWRYRLAVANKEETLFRKAELATSGYMLLSYLVLIIAKAL